MRCYILVINAIEPIVKKGKIMRKPKVQNKYNLKPKDIQKATILDYERLKQPPFWRNDVVQAWCLSENTAKNSKDFEFCCYNDYWIGFYDVNAKTYALYYNYCHKKQKRLLFAVLLAYFLLNFLVFVKT